MGEASPPNAALSAEAFITRSRRPLLLLALLIVLSHALLFGAGALVLRARPGVPGEVGALEGPVSWIKRVDAYGMAVLTSRFEPAFAPGLHAALGPTLPFYGALGVFVLFAALIRQWRTVPRTVLAALFAVLLGLELATVGAAVNTRPAPVASGLDLPVSEEWRFAWQARSAYPSRHALVAAALGGSVAIAWAPLGLAGCGLALAGSAAAVYFGAAYVSDVAVALALGAVAALAGRLGAALVPSGTLP